MTIPQAAVDAARQVLLDEGLLDSDRDGQKHYRGYCDAVVTITLEAAMPHLRARVDRLRADVESAELKADHYNEEIVASHEDRDEARARLAAVEEMHVPPPGLGPAYCTECDQLHPCDTTKAVRGE